MHVLTTIIFPSHQSILSSGAKFFSTLNLKHACQQLSLAEDARQICTINTINGLYLINSRQMGFENSSSIFQSCMETLLKRIKGIRVYQNPHLYQQQSKIDQLRKYSSCKAKMQFFINKEKSFSRRRNLTFLEMNIYEENIFPSQELVAKLKDI